MSRFLIDNNLSPKISQALRELGFDAVHVREYEMQRAPDQEIFECALKEERLIVSADTDFGFLLAKWGKEKPSVALFRHFPSSSEHQVQALLIIVKKFESELKQGSMIVIEPKGIRIRKLPF